MEQIKSKLWKKISLVCLLLGIVPTVLVGTLSYFIASGTVQKKVGESNMGELRQVQLSVESQLISVEKSMLQLISSPTVAHAAGTEMTGDRFDVFNDLETTINTLPMTGMSVGTIRLFNIRQHWVASNTGVTSQTDYEADYGPASRFLNGSRLCYWVDAQSAAQEGVSGAADKASPGYVTLVRRNVYSNDACFCTVDVFYSSFDDLVSAGARQNAIEIISSDGCVIYDRSYPKRGQNVSSTALFRQAVAQRSGRGSFTIRIDGVRCGVSFIKSDSNGWIYLMVTSIAQMTRDSQAIGWVTALICMALILLVGLAALSISTRAYQPIRRLYDVLVPDTAGNPDEIRQIEEIVGLLMTSRDDMKEQMYSQSGQLMEYFSLRLLLDENDENFIRSKVQVFHYPERPPRMVVAVAQIDPVESGYGPDDEDLLLYAVNNIIGEMFSERIVIIPVIIGNRQITVLRVGGAYKDEVYAGFRQLQDILRQKLDFTVSVGVSLPIDSYRDIHACYIKCLYAIQYQFFQDRNSIGFMEDLLHNQGARPEYPAELENQILDAVRSGDKDQCFAMIHLFVENVSRAEGNRDAVKIFLIRLVIDLIILQQETDPHSQVPDQLLLAQLSDMHNQAGIENWLQHSVAEPVIDCLARTAGDRMKRICRDVLRIIHAEYRTKLTLEDCAARLNYHPSYIRRVLKKEMGITFSEYLQGYRIKVAERWLTENDMKIAAIAENLAYENTENFIRAFKKATGMTPRQYRDGKSGC